MFTVSVATGVALHVGVAIVAIALGYALGRRSGRPAKSATAPEAAGPAAQPDPSTEPRSTEEAEQACASHTHGTLYPARLLSQTLRDPIHRLRRTPGVEPEVISKLERIAWQARMLVSKPRPMQALPTALVSLLQEAAEQVESLRLGKVHASWTLLTRQPVHVDPARTRAAFRELLASGTEVAGEAGRLGIRIVPGPREGYPVQVEIEIGRRGAEVDSLSALVARHLLETQGAKMELDGHIVRIHLRTLAPPQTPAQTPSNR